MKRRGEQNPANSTATAGRTVAIEDVVQGGTTQKDGFVPPHVLVRDEEKARAKASGASRSIYDK
jgi:saccharopine dehydrogenase-like NADP-dependent oxidoreductase